MLYLSRCKLVIFNTDLYILEVGLPFTEFSDFAKYWTKPLAKSEFLVSVQVWTQSCFREANSTETGLSLN